MSRKFVGILPFEVNIHVLLHTSEVSVIYIVNVLFVLFRARLGRIVELKELLARLEVGPSRIWVPFYLLVEPILNLLEVAPIRVRSNISIIQKVIVEHTGLTDIQLLG